MHGRIVRSTLVVIAALLPAAPAAAHDVQMKAVHGSIPAANWDEQASTWTIDLAAMIDCDANGTRVDGAMLAEPIDGSGALGGVLVSGLPRRVVRQSFNGLGPGEYRLNFAAAGCSAEPQSDSDEGNHADSYENIVLQTFKLPDCRKRKAVYARSFDPRPLIPADQSLPPNATIACPAPPPPPPCRATRAIFRQPLVPVKGTDVTVEPCKPPGSDQPAADVGCKQGTARAAAITSPLVPGPPGNPPPKSTAQDCYGAIELQAAPVKKRTCTRPLVPVRCEPEPVDPAMGYTAALQTIKRIRFKVGKGQHEYFVLKLSKAARAKAMSEGIALRFVITVRDRKGRVHRTTSSQFTLEG